MNPKNPALDLTRRKFVGSCCAAVGATGMLSTLSQLRLIGASAADSLPGVTTAATTTDYKALVCLFLAGGNDANNLIIPTDAATYAAYAAARTAIAIPQASVLPLSPRTSDGRSFGLHPSATGLQTLFGQGKLALLANVGTLIAPATLADFQAQRNLPPQLFSHNDQQVEWQRSVPDKPFTTGWGGRLADLVNSTNSNSRISMSISLNGNNSFQVGNTVSQYAVDPTGAIRVSVASGSPLNNVRYTAQKDLLTQTQNNLFQTAFAGLSGGAINDSELLNSILSATPPFTTQFPAQTSVSSQLQMIARLIAAAPQFGLKRQIFFARIGGWDLHTGQLPAHATLFTQVSQALSAFYAATAELGVANQVTTFTASDFGRTLNTNGDGSDHGWGSHHLVMGGAVAGGDIYGRMPSLRLGGPDDTGRGRWLPSTSVDEYNSTLATWFGVTPTNLATVLPNIGRFAKPNLGFLG